MTEIMRLNTIQPADGHKKVARRVGRGVGSGLGKTCGRGHKGLKSRSGGTVAPGFEGGQMPLQKRLPKFGFTSRVSRFSAQVRTSELALLSSELVDIDALKNADIIGQNIQNVKIFLSGDVTKVFNIIGLGVTKGARAAIETAGGRVEE